MIDPLQHFEKEYNSINETVSKIASLSLDSIANYKDFISTQKSFIESLFNIPQVSEINTESFANLLTSYISDLAISLEKFNVLVKSLNDISSSFQPSNFIKNEN